MAIKSTLVSHTSNKDESTYVFKNVSDSKLAEYVTSFLSQQGYVLESGVPGNGVYGSGSAAMRVLFGGFAKRYKVRVSITSSQDTTSLHLSRAMSGAAGGVIGYKKMEKEFERISLELKERAGSLAP